jgi:hypothetical protein
MMHVKMTDLSSFARRYGLPIDGAAIVCGEARIVQPEDSPEMFAYTADERTAKALWNSQVGSVLHDGTCGRLSLKFSPRGLGAIVQAIEGVYRS